MPPALSLLGRPLAPPPLAGPRPARDLALEGLRGAAALTVLAAHLCTPEFALDPAYAPTVGFGRFNLSHAAVLVFFALSGYVIGLAVRGPADAPSIRSYAWRRFRRLAPINALAVVLGVIAGPGGEWLAGLLNLLFLQNSAGYGALSAPLLRSNLNLWSLNYEAVCYAVFVAVWLWRPRVGLVLALCLASGLGLWFAPGLAFLAHWALGLVFWFAGLALAWNRTLSAAPADTSPWPAAILALAATRLLEPLHSPFARLGLGAPDHTAVIAADLAYLFPVVWLLASVSGAAPRARRPLALVSCGPLLALCAWRLAHGQIDAAHERIGLACILAACALACFPCGHGLLRRLAPVGLVSYALYALAAPLQHLVLAIPSPSGSAVTWALRALLAVAISLLFAWLAERGWPAWRAVRERRYRCQP
jgi:peptidoglycan/LPS O-acetylase OafA/YrhL